MLFLILEANNDASPLVNTERIDIEGTLQIIWRSNEYVVLTQLVRS